MLKIQKEDDNKIKPGLYLIEFRRRRRLCPSEQRRRRSIIPYDFSDSLNQNMDVFVY